MRNKLTNYSYFYVHEQYPTFLNCSSIDIALHDLKGNSKEQGKTFTITLVRNAITSNTAIKKKSKALIAKIEKNKQ